jgi:F420-dependent oxidoreductase-like protein
MKLCLNIGYSGPKMVVPMERILRAEALGFDTVWTSEAYGSDAITPLAYIGALTKRIRVGTNIAQLAARTPANLAMSAQTIDAMIGRGRMILGIGVSGPQIVEGWYGQPWGKPADRLRDYVAIIKKVLRRDEPLTHAGREISLPYTGPGATGLGKPLKSILHGNPDIPVMLGTATPGNIRLTGEIADGWLSMHLVPSTMRQYTQWLQEGLAKRSDGKTLKDFDIHGWLSVVITSDVKAALNAGKPRVALYVGGMGAKDKNYHKDSMVRRGFPEAAERIQELYLAGRKEEAAAAVPDEYVDEQALIGPTDRIMERWPKWRDCGMTMLSLNEPTDEAMEVMANLVRLDG